jgi:hypothetical protein
MFIAVSSERLDHYLPESKMKTETELYEQIGRLKMELEWLKKSCQHT